MLSDEDGVGVEGGEGQWIGDGKFVQCLNQLEERHPEGEDLGVVQARRNFWTCENDAMIRMFD